MHRRRATPAFRSYHSWVANETLEDYSLRYTARAFRRWSPFVIANTALGGISFLALEAIGAVLTLSYGFANVMPAVLLASLFIFVVSLPIAYYSSRDNVDMDLLTRGAGFGYIGSTITSIIYAIFTFIFFALEGAIMAQALQLYTDLPLPIGYLISSLVIIPITFMGVTMISRLQLATQPFWIVLMLAPFIAILVKEPGLVQDWASFAPASMDGFNWLAFGTALGVLGSLCIQIGEQVDYLRFLPDREEGNRVAWWLAMVLAGPGWILIGGAKILAGSFLAVLLIHAGLPHGVAVEPVRMYLEAYGFLTDDPALAVLLATVFVIISQVKINVTNAYAGSLAWSNFFSRVTHFHPGRVVWLIFNIVISLLLMLLGIFETLEVVLRVYSNVAIGWIGALFADLAILKPLGVSPRSIEFKRAHLYDINPVGCGAMAIASVLSVAAFAGAFGPTLEAYSAPLSFVVALIAAVALGFATGGRYYLARSPARFFDNAERSCRCEVCVHSYEPADMAWCPFYERPICSLCCSLEAHCHDTCKPHRHAASGARLPLALGFATKIAPRTGWRLAKVAAIFTGFAVVSGALLLLIYRLVALDNGPPAGGEGLLGQTYLALLPLLAVGAWWIVLAHERRELAERELVLSLEQLQEAQEGLAQSERLAAIGQLTATVSHELRNPLGTLVASLEILRRAIQRPSDAARAELDRMQRTIWRCERIIEDLLEFSRRSEPALAELAVDDWLRRLLGEQELPPGIRLELDLEAKGRWQLDAARLEHVVLNLFHNAVQAIEARGMAGACDAPGPQGLVRIATRPEGDALVLVVSDNGCGMTPDVQARVFEPLFSTKAFGVGLGMPLARRIVEQHGGSLEAVSEPGRGTTMTIRLPGQRAASPKEKGLLHG